MKKLSALKTGLAAAAIATAPLVNGQQEQAPTVDVTSRIVMNGTPYLPTNLGHITSVDNINKSQNPIMSRIVPNNIGMGASMIGPKDRFIETVHVTGVNKGAWDYIVPKAVIMNSTFDFNNNNGTGWASAFPIWKTELPVDAQTAGGKIAKTAVPSKLAVLSILANRQSFNSITPMWDLTTLTKGSAVERVLPQGVSVNLPVDHGNFGKLGFAKACWNTKFNPKTKAGKIANAIIPDQVDLFYKPDRQKKWGVDFVYTFNK